MEIREDIHDGVAVLAVTGRLSSGPEVAEFQDHIKKLAQRDLYNVVVDFSDVQWFGSAMLGVMTASLAILRKGGGDMRLTGVTSKIESILKVTRLTDVFKALSSVEQAVASFEAKSA